MSIAVVGALTFDTIETPAGQASRVLGGSAAYAALATSLLAPAHIVSVVGDDFPPQTWAALRSRGIGLESVITAPGPTFFWHCRYHANMEDRDTLFTDTGAFGRVPVEVRPQAAAAAHVFLTSGHPWQNQTALPGFGRRHLTMMDTIEREVVEERAALLEIMRAADLVSINEAEAALLTGAGAGTADAGALATQLLTEYGVPTLLLKAGPRGAMVAQAGHRVQIPAVPGVRALDPTGAGDSFAGGVLSALACGAPLDDAVRWGCAVASFTVEAFGPEALFALRREDVSARAGRIGLLEAPWMPVTSVPEVAP